MPFEAAGYVGRSVELRRPYPELLVTLGFTFPGAVLALWMAVVNDSGIFALGANQADGVYFAVGILLGWLFAVTVLRLLGVARHPSFLLRLDSEWVGVPVVPLLGEPGYVKLPRAQITEVVAEGRGRTRRIVIKTPRGSAAISRMWLPENWTIRMVTDQIGAHLPRT